MANEPLTHGSDPVRELVTSTLEAALRATGECRYKAALGMVRNFRAGNRPAHDDTAALQAMKDMVGAGDALSVEEAARRVAHTLTGQHSSAAARARLAWKYRRLYSGKGVK